MSEITYVFNNLYGTDLPWHPVDYEIAETLSSYWANFVKTSNSNTGGSYGGNGTLAHWAPSNSSRATTFHLAPPAPINKNGLPVGYAQVPVATKDHITLLNKFFLSRAPL
jgi:carboxylesterase 2